MGLTFRKSVGFGPFRLNFSKSGVSYSFGVKGARINTGSRGTYVNFGSNGIYYRKKINTSAKPKQVQTYEQNSEPQIINHTITSAPIDQLTDADSKDFIDELTKKSNKISFLNWFGIPLTIFFIVLMFIFYLQPSRTTFDKKYFVQVNSKTGYKIRQQPDKNSKYYSIAQNLEKFDLIDSLNKNWYKIDYSGSIGYISKNYAVLDSIRINERIYTRLDDNSTSFWIILFIGILTCGLLCYYLHNKDRERLLIEIYYDIDEKVKEVYDKFIEHFAEIIISEKVWQYLNSRHTNDFKHNAGASHLIVRIGVKRISTDKKPERFFITNVEIPNIQLRNTDLYFFPERLLIKRDNQFAAIFYKNLNLYSRLTNFVETDSLPSDAQVVDKTWRFLNKNGSPDKRFNNNRQIPICSYSEYHFESDTGVNEVLTTSKKGVFDNFVNFVGAIGQLQKRMSLK
jgi:hypothetical protein